VAAARGARLATDDRGEGACGGPHRRDAVIGDWRFIAPRTPATSRGRDGGPAPSGARQHTYGSERLHRGRALHAGALAAGRIAEVLAETDPRAFVVDRRTSPGATCGSRPSRSPARERCVSFGSCSFDDR